MTVCLGSYSAIQCWQSSGYSESDGLQSLPCVIPQMDDVTRRTLRLLGVVSRPVHCVVPKHAHRRNTREITSAIWNVPNYVPVCQIVAKGIYVCSPEASFVQVAGGHGRRCSRHSQYARFTRSDELPKLLELVRLGYSMCGSYAYGTRDGFEQVEPVMSVERLNAFLDVIPGKKGAGLARRAAAVIAEGAASPMEAALTMLLCLPQSMGGCGLPMPQLNFPIHIESAPDMWKSGTVVCDLYWPKQKLALEYDSSEFHTGATRINRDSARRTALLNEGIGVISVTSGQVTSAERMEELAQATAKALGRRLRIRVDDWQARHELLRSIVFPWLA